MTLRYLALNTVQALFTAVWSVFWMTSAMVITLLTFDRETALMMARRFYSPGILWAAQTKLVVDPLPAVDWSQPHIYVANHQSMLDIPVAFAVIPANLRFVAKKVLAYVPFLGWYMWATGMIFIDRRNRAQAVKSLQLAGERIRAGANIIAFPEGTRSRDGQILPFKKGPFHLAVEAGVPIIPVAIEGTLAQLKTGGFNVRPGTVRVKLGAPIATKDRPRDELLHEVRETIIRMHREIGGEGGTSQEIANVGIEGVG